MEREAMEMIVQFFAQYGWKLALIACSGIFILGILKFFHVFDKIEKTKRKYVYAAVSTVLSLIASLIYLLCTNTLEWATFGVYSASLYAFNQIIYSMYETFGIRSVVRKFGHLCLKVIKKMIEESEQAELLDKKPTDLLEPETNDEVKEEDQNA